MGDKVSAASATQQLESTALSWLEMKNHSGEKPA